MYLFVSNIRQNEISFAIKIHINIPLFFSNKSHGLEKKKLLIEKKCFFCRLCKNYWTTFVHTCVACSPGGWGSVGNDIDKKDLWKLKHFEKIIFLKKFYMIFHFLSPCVFMSVWNIGRSIPLIRRIFKKLWRIMDKIFQANSFYIHLLLIII